MMMLLVYPMIMIFISLYYTYQVYSPGARGEFRAPPPVSGMTHIEMKSIIWEDKIHLAPNFFLGFRPQNGGLKLATFLLAVTFLMT